MCGLSMLRQLISMFVRLIASSSGTSVAAYLNRRFDGGFLIKPFIHSITSISGLASGARNRTGHQGVPIAEDFTDGQKHSIPEARIRTGYQGVPVMKYTGCRGLAVNRMLDGMHAGTSRPACGRSVQGTIRLFRPGGASTS